jgi:hypothetical protein
MTDPVEDYLDELADRLPVRGRQLRRTLAEVEDHLRTATAAGIRAGLDETEAARRAVAAFGAPAAVARTMSRGGGPLSAALLIQAFLSLLLVAGTVLVAIGVSGLVAGGAGAAFGKPFVAGDAPGVTYTAQRCAEYHVLAPQTSTCADAAVSHHFDEVVGYRLDAGVLGLMALGLWLAIARPWRRRRGQPLPSYDVLPTGFGATVGATLFGLASATLLPAGLMDLAFSGSDAGAGGLISAGLVSVVGFLGFGLALWRSLAARSV